MILSVFSPLWFILFGVNAVLTVIITLGRMGEGTKDTICS